MLNLNAVPRIMFTLSLVGGPEVFFNGLVGYRSSGVAVHLRVKEGGTQRCIGFSRRVGVLVCLIFFTSFLLDVCLSRASRVYYEFHK